MPLLEQTRPGVMDCVFGHGDISISTAVNAATMRPNALVFHPVAKGEIGRSMSEHNGKRTDEMGGHIRFIFDCVQSLDVLVEQAQKLRDSMIAYDKEMSDAS